MAAVESVPEPDWFLPTLFFTDVMTFTFRELQLMNQNQLDVFPMVYREAVEKVGRAVFTLRLIIRPKVRLLCLGSMVELAGLPEFVMYEKIAEFMSQGYLNRDIFKATLTSFAIIGELCCFFAEYGSPIPFYWQAFPWVYMYTHRLKDKLLAKGGWEELVRRVTQSYTDSKLFEDTRDKYRNNLPIPHAEPLGGPEDDFSVRFEDEFSVGFVQYWISLAPSDTELAMEVLQKMFESVPYMMPA